MKIYLPNVDIFGKNMTVFRFWDLVTPDKNSKQITNINMERILQNYGLTHIALKIFDYLDFKSLCKARLTSQSWKDFIDTFSKPNRIQWKLTLTFHSKKWFLELWPEWKCILSDFVQNRTSVDVNKLLEIVNYYFNTYPHVLNILDPLMMAIGNV